MTLKQDNSDVIKAPKKTGVLTEEAKGLKKTIEEADKDLAKSSFGKLLVDVKNEQSLTEAEKKELAKKRKKAAIVKKKKQEKLAKKKREEAHKESLENAKNNLVSSATNIEISDKGEIKIDMDLSKLVKKESGKKVDLTDVFTPDVMHASIELSKVDKNGKNQIDKRKIERGMINGVPAYFYKEKGKKITLDISTYSTAKISISREDLMHDGKFLTRSEVLKKLKREAEAKAKKAAEKELNKLPKKLIAEMPDEAKKASINDQVLFELAKGGPSNKSGGGSSGGSGGRPTGGSSGGSGGRSGGRSYGGGRSSGGRSSGGRSSGGRSSGGSYKSKKAYSHEHTSSSSFEVTGDYANEPFVSSVDYRGKEFKLRVSAMNALEIAIGIAAKNDPPYRLKIISSYRTLSRQKVLAANNLDRSRVARPGGSNHHAGGTVDVHAINQNTGRKNQKYLKTLFSKVNDELKKRNPNTPLWVNYKEEDWHWEFGSGRYDKTRKNIYPKVMALNKKNVIPYDTYLAKVEEVKKKKEQQQMLASKPGVIEEGGNSFFAAEVEKFPGLKWAGRLSGNGGNDVAVLVPPHFDPKLKPEVIYAFAGLNAELANWTDSPPKKAYTHNYLHKEKGKVHAGKDRFNQAAQQIVARTNKNAILVYPIRGVKPWEWMDPVATKGKEDMGRLHTEVLDVIKNKLNLEVNIAKITGQGHSAGGQPLRNAAKSGFAFNKLVFLDATYGHWGRDTYNAMKKNGLFDQCEELQIVYIPNSKTAKDALDVARIAARDNNSKIKMVPVKMTRTERHATMNTYHFAGEYDPNPQYEFYDSSPSSFV